MGLFKNFNPIEYFRKRVTRGEKFLEGETQAIDFGKLDRRYFERGVKDWAAWKKLINDGTKKHANFEALMTDIFMALYLPHPDLRPVEDMQIEYRQNHLMLEEAMKLELYREARETAELHRMNATIGAMFIGQSLLENMPEEEPLDEELEEELKEVLHQMAQAEQEADQKESEAQAAQGTEGEAEAQAQSAEAQEAEAQAQAQLQEVLAKVEEAQAEGRDAARQAMRKAFQEANGKMEEVAGTLSSWGTEPGELKRVPADEAMKLYNKMKDRPALKDLTNRIGRFRDAFLEAKKEKTIAAAEIVDVDHGGEFLKLLPSEQMGMIDPDLDGLYVSRFMQHATMQWDNEGVQDAAMGPFICCVDVSGSMSGSGDQWAKGFTLAALERAEDTRRDVRIIFFDSEVRPDGVFDFPEGYATIAQKIQLAEFFTGGGTVFRDPLDLALQAIESNPRQWGKADIVLVTDGGSHLSSEWIADYRERCRKRGVRIHGVQVDGEATSTLQALADHVSIISSLSEEAGDLYKNII